MQGYETKEQDLTERLGSHIDKIIEQLGWDEHIRDASQNSLDLSDPDLLAHKSTTGKTEIATAAAIVFLGAKYAGIDQEGQKSLSERISECEYCKSVKIYPQDIWFRQKKIRDYFQMKWKFF